MYLGYRVVWRLHLPPSSPSVIASFGDGKLGLGIEKYLTIAGLLLSFLIQGLPNRVPFDKLSSK